MNSNKLNWNSRIVLFLCAILLIVVLYVPMWSIELNAPQYPEGLGLSIYANKLGGNVDIINGLNHYIGMKTLHEKDFVEFIVLPYFILFFSIFCLVTALVARKKLLYTLLALFILFGVLAMADFWRWEYNYGHDLNPDAAIIVPGMSYQPPLIGYKQLLNFGAYSMPDIGGWIFILVGLALLTLSILAYRNKSKIITYKKSIHASVLGLLFLLTNAFACNTIPNSIKIGKDACSYCKMTVSDNRFGVVLVTEKGKNFIFDDPQCLAAHLHSPQNSSIKIGGIYFTNFIGSHLLLNANEAFFVKSIKIHGPMNGSFAAFSNKDSAMRYIFNNTGSIVKLNELLQ
jgi:copper chaperone NosL